MYIFKCTYFLNEMYISILFPGTMIPKSGGDYAYIGEAFGSLPSFLYLWVALFILVPTGNAITALTFAQNILKPLWPACTPPDAAVSLIAASVTCEYLRMHILKRRRNFPIDLPTPLPTLNSP